MKHMMIKVLSVLMALTMIMGMFGAVALSAADHVHTKGDKIKDVAPTCVAYGYTLYECADCGEEFATDIVSKKADAHSYVAVEAVEATCTTAGNTAGTRCEYCGDVKDGCTTIPWAGHNKVIAIEEATCDSDGRVYEKCSVCNKDFGTLKDLEAASGHVFEYEITVYPSCNESGLATYRCVACDECTVEGIYVAPTGDHVIVEADEKPTCTLAGFKGKYCSECYEIIEGEVVDALGHEFELLDVRGSYAVENGITSANVKLDPTCTEDGYAWEECSVCGLVEKRVKEALGHDWAEPGDPEYILNKATCEEDGYYLIGCERCDVDKKVYDLDEDGDNDYPCLSETGAHVYATASVLTDSDLTNNKFWKVVNPTCSTEESKGYGWIEAFCMNDGCVCTVENCPEGPTPHSVHKTVESIPALECDITYKCDTCQGVCYDCTHANRKAICLNEYRWNASNGAWEVKAGSNCDVDQGEVITAATHNMSTDEDFVKIPATCSEDAYDAYYCKNPGCAHTEKAMGEDENGNPVYVGRDYTGTKKTEGKNNHTAKVQVSYTPATCVAKGSITYACKNCAADEWTEEIPMLSCEEDGKWTIIPAVAPTCSTKGSTMGVTCDNCGVILEPEEVAVVADNHVIPTILGLTVKASDYMVPGANSTLVLDEDAYEAALEAALTNAKTTAAALGFETDAVIDLVMGTDGSIDVVVDFGLFTFIRPATCSMPALYIYNCEEPTCGKECSFTTEKDPDNHQLNIYNDDGTLNTTLSKDSTIVIDPAKAPDCLNDGAHEYHYCTECDWDEIIPCADNANACVTCKALWALNHDTDTTNNVTAADVAEEIEVVIDKLGHDIKDLVASPETCTQNGYTAGTYCGRTDCEYYYPDTGKTLTGGDVIIAHGDAYLEEVEYVPPTCTETGWANVEYCTKCQDKEDVALLPALGHNNVVIKTVPNSCTEIGYVVYACDKCAAGKIDPAVVNDDMIQFEWVDIDGDDIVDVETECNWYITNFKYATGHDMDADDDGKDDVKEGYIVNGTPVPAAAATLEMKCVTDKVKYVECACGYYMVVETVEAAEGHYFLQAKGDKKPLSADCVLTMYPNGETCIEDSYGFACTACGKSFNKNVVTPVHTIVPVELAPTCTETGLSYYACSGCNQAFYTNSDAYPIDWANDSKGQLATITTPAAGHQYGATVEYVPAKDYEDGKWVWSCAVCGEKTTVVLKASDEVDFVVSAVEVNGSSVATNGSTVKVSLAFSAKNYNFRDLTIAIEIVDIADMMGVDTVLPAMTLIADKTEFKYAYDSSLMVTSEVVTDDNYVYLYTAVNKPGAEATLTGEDVAFVDLYFTVELPDDSVLDMIDGIYAEAHYYDGSVLDADYWSFNFTQGADVDCAIAGDVVDSGYTNIDTADLIAVMDMIYTEGAKYDARADVNKDGVVDIADYAAIKTFVFSGQSANDYAAMVGDEALVSPNMEEIVLGIFRTQKIDMNDDGIINLTDVALLMPGASAMLNADIFNEDYVYEAYFAADIYTTDILVKVLTEQIVEEYEDYLASL